MSSPKLRDKMRGRISKDVVINQNIAILFFKIKISSKSKTEMIKNTFEETIINVSSIETKGEGLKKGPTSHGG